MRKYVGERVQKLREAQGLTQQDVCKLAGLELSQLQAYEDGTAVPSVGVVINLSRISMRLKICQEAGSFNWILTTLG